MKHMHNYTFSTHKCAACTVFVQDILVCGTYYMIAHTQQLADKISIHEEVCIIMCYMFEFKPQSSMQSLCANIIF